MKTDPTLAWIDPRTLGDAARRELWRFVLRYEELAYEDFCAQVAELSRAFVGRHASGEIGALVAARIFTVRRDGRESTLVWGEWGLLDPPFRGRRLLERAMLRGVLESRLQSPLRPVYFMAEAASPGGYRALARVFANHLWPRPGSDLPDAERRLANEVLARSGDAAWDPSRGVFHRGKPLRSTEGEGRDTALDQLYRRLNPGHLAGDSLLCVARVTSWSLLKLSLGVILGLVRARRTRAAPGSVKLVA